MDNLTAQPFLFIFRHNGLAHGEPLVEASAEQLADYDPSVASAAVKRAWYGTEKDLNTLLNQLGFERFDIGGVMGALHDHRDADRRRTITVEHLESVGFKGVL